MRKLVLSSDEDDKNMMSRNLIGEPSVLECISGEARGLSRVIDRLLKIEATDDEGEKVVARGFYNTIEYEVDRRGKLTFDDKEGVATFSSRGVRYKIRAIQESDDAYWRALQDEKRG